jgi:uncharacterized glyoxalase superfamily protein PhnB
MENTYRTVTPYLVVKDGDAELKFLEAAFGAKQKFCERRPDNTVMHAEVTIGDSLIMLGQSNDQYRARAASFFLWVDDADETYAKALAAGATSESPVGDKPYGRSGGVTDSNGQTWWMTSATKQ